MKTFFKVNDAWMKSCGYENENPVMEIVGTESFITANPAFSTMYILKGPLGNWTVAACRGEEVTVIEEQVITDADVMESQASDALYYYSSGEPQTLSIRDLMDCIKRDDIKHDPWGTAMNWLFCLCDELELDRGVATPDHWEFMASPFGDGTEGNHPRDIMGDVSDADLLRFGEVLHRFIATCDAKGLSY